MTPANLRVRKYLENLGMKILVEEFEDWGNCPFDHSADLDWENKVLRIEPDLWATECVELLIHEAGHALACALHPNSNPRPDEFLFFGWEFAVAVQCDAVEQWLHGHRDYGVGNGTIIRDIDAEGRSDVIEERFQTAQELGLVVGDTPQVIR